jgi:hypothetical protein|tara:strand:+ start:12114 stop:12290 length:177 start_codon:yes stop_codon:yes gene_type:complete
MAKVTENILGRARGEIGDGKNLCHNSSKLVVLDCPALFVVAAVSVSVVAVITVLFARR